MKDRTGFNYRFGAAVFTSAIAALALAASASAHFTPHWFSEGELIKEGEVVPVRSFSGGEFKTITLDALGAESCATSKMRGA